jgi:spore germination protein GerM
MKVLRAVLVVGVLAVAAYFAYRYVVEAGWRTADTVTVYYCKTDGETLAPWKVSLGVPVSGTTDRRTDIAAYALAQALVGPPPPTAAIRFPPGTVARGLNIQGSTVTVDLGGTIAGSTGGSFAEAGEFKALVWTLTALPGISAVQIEIDGRKVPALPGGHLELDQPLSRSSF